MASYGYEYIDLVNAFETLPQQNYLLQSLGFFDKSTSQTPKVEIDRLIDDNKTLFNDNQTRYGSDHNTTQLAQPLNYLVEIGHHARVDSITPQDFQGRRAFAEDREQTLAEVSLKYLTKHKTAHNRTIEAYYANALFNAKVNSPKTSEIEVDWASAFGIAQQTSTVDLSSTSLDLVEYFNTIVDNIQIAAGGLITNIKRIVVLAGASFYNQLRFSASLKSYFQYVSPVDPSNVVTIRHEDLPGIQSFTMPGLQVDVIKVTDPLLTVYLGSNEAVALPLFTSGTEAYSHISGPASRDMDLALGATKEYWSYVKKSDDWNDLSVRYEMGVLPVNHVFNLSVRITNTAV